MELSCKEATSYAGFAGREMQLGSRKGVDCGGGNVRADTVPWEGTVERG